MRNSSGPKFDYTPPHLKQSAPLAARESSFQKMSQTIQHETRPKANRSDKLGTIPSSLYPPEDEEESFYNDLRENGSGYATIQAKRGSVKPAQKRVSSLLITYT
jgi:hypothetical protein